MHIKLSVDSTIFKRYSNRDLIVLNAELNYNSNGSPIFPIKIVRSQKKT